STGPAGALDEDARVAAPAPASGSADPVLQRDDTDPPVPVPPAPATAIVPATIKAAASPAGMTDRITPGIGVQAAVSMSGWAAGADPVKVSVEGSGTAGGTVTVDGAAEFEFPQAAAGAANVSLVGTVQTAVGSAGGLKLVATQGGNVLVRSAAFSVSAIPQDYTDTFVSLLTDNRRGFVVQDGWSSDSAGGIADLDGAEISEHVEYGGATGCFAGNARGSNSGFLPANALTKDTHSRGKAELTSPGVLVTKQTCSFNDKRSGSLGIPLRNSGFVITRTVAAQASGIGGFFRSVVGRNLKITTAKVGGDTDANGVASAAGTGNIVKTQNVASGAEV
ncbi:MAG: hypothetical protein ACRDZW_02765, partial [Acidimicrobiales bacterium]